MLDHSHIGEQRSLSSHSHLSDIAELTRLRELLPNHSRSSSSEVYNIQDDYLIREQQGESLNTSSDSQSEIMLKIGEMTHRIIETEQQLFHFRTQFFRALRENQTIKDREKSILQQLQQAEQQIEEEKAKYQQQERLLQDKNREVEELRKNIQRLRVESRPVTPPPQVAQPKIHEENHIQERLIRELTVKNDKLLKINQFLQAELRTAEIKLIELEKDVQQRMCSLLTENVIRLKENQNIGNNQHAKANLLRQTIEREDEDEELRTTTNKLTHRDRAEPVEPDRREFKTLEKDRSHRYHEQPKPQQAKNPTRYYSTHINRNRKVTHGRNDH